MAAFLVSQASGWDVVPPTVFRDDAPVGPGMLQLWVEVREDVDVVELVRAADPRLRRIALFDAVVNNADRKAGHLLVRADGIIQGVDHGVTFSVDPKLRTVLWGWRGTKLADREMEALALLRRALARLRGHLEAHLAPDELAATRSRIEDDCCEPAASPSRTPTGRRCPGPGTEPHRPGSFRRPRVSVPVRQPSCPRARPQAPGARRA